MKWVKFVTQILSWPGVASPTFDEQVQEKTDSVRKGLSYKTKPQLFSENEICNEHTFPLDIHILSKNIQLNRKTLGNYLLNFKEALTHFIPIPVLPYLFINNLSLAAINND